MIRVYHGSNEAIEKPLVGIGRPYLDFGTGFYVTNMIAQAETWAGIKARLFNQPEGTVSLYDFDLDAAVAAYRFHKFEAYDREWLHFIVNNRDGGDDWKQYDVIEGGVANDRVIDTVENYRAGLIDEDTALRLLSALDAPAQPTEQRAESRTQVRAISSRDGGQRS